MRGADDVPMVRIGPGVSIQYLQVDLQRDIRVTRAQLEPGLKLRRHTHTGHVFAWTLGGSWLYTEYPQDVNVAGCYLYEEAGSSHTLVGTRTPCDLGQCYARCRRLAASDGSRRARACMGSMHDERERSEAKRQTKRKSGDNNLRLDPASQSADHRVPLALPTDHCR